MARLKPRPDIAGSLSLKFLMLGMHSLRAPPSLLRCTFPHILTRKESAVFSRSYRVRLIVILAVLIAAATFLGTAAAQKASVSRAQDRLALGEEHYRELLLIIETDQGGMISKPEYMKFVEAEFQRLDKSHRGQLHARELNQATLSANRLAGK
jgi:hypothetical protein